MDFCRLKPLSNRTYFYRIRVYIPNREQATTKHSPDCDKDKRMDINTDQRWVPGGTDLSMQNSHQSDTAALSLFSLRRKGVQMVLTMMLGTLLSVLIIFLIFFGFNRVEGTLNSDLTRLATTHDVPASAMDRSLQEI